MNYKIEGALRRNRKNLIVYAIIWLLIAIMLIPAITYAYAIATTTGSSGLANGIKEFGRVIKNPIEAFVCLGKIDRIGEYFATLLGATIIYSIFFFIGFVRTAPKNEFTDIEHGSSDWSKNGEQYKILSKKQGIILAENNYLPVDKRGNVNVLVVGRFRFW